MTVATEIDCVPLGPADAKAVRALHLASMAAMDRPDLVKPEAEDFFPRLLAGEGRILGAFQAGRLVGYGVLQVDLPPSEDARPWLGLPASESLAKLAGAGVAPEVWGGGLHDVFIAWRVAEGRRLGVDHLYATAAPGNFRSWENLMTGGFGIRGLVEKYGGQLRYLLYRRADAPCAHEDDAAPLTAAQTGRGLWVASEDVAGQQALIAQGLTGLRRRRRADGGRDVWYDRE